MNPAEIIGDRAAGVIDTAQMMDQLLNCRYSFRGVGQVDGAPAAGATSGDWDDIEMAFYCGLLTDDEFQTLAVRHLQHRDARP